ncbi:alpha-S1-casein [Ochotona curzoniae]|uniref:alpha-S1-casein n=1 Tax=Ochotona curzoniae TaxID=130825 RepID=UPI001B348468|nr:alpha-S1-casein [Ochotona curzoniae]
MKLLILTCLVAAALARPKFPFRHLKFVENQPINSEEIIKERQPLSFFQTAPIELGQEYINELNRQGELEREKQIDEIKEIRNEVTQEHVMEEREPREVSSSSSSEEVVINSTEKQFIPREDLLYPFYPQQQLLRMNEHYQIQREPMRVMNQQQEVQFYPQLLQPFYQPDAYLPAPWYYPTDVMQYVAFPLIYDITTPNTPVNVEQTDVMPEW